ncbi:MAG: hypothetical protein JXA11_05885 [Phycisphaerae bacterium]|nr:hypothetical protein [Phycisphaerae bacterium]
MPPHKEPHRVVRNGQPDFTKFMEDSISPELLETIQKVHEIKDQEDQLMSILGTYESAAEETSNNRIIT